VGVPLRNAEIGNLVDWGPYSSLRKLSRIRLRLKELTESTTYAWVSEVDVIRQTVLESREWVDSEGSVAPNMRGDADK